MNLNAASLFDQIKAQLKDQPACVLTIYRWFFEKDQHVTVDIPLVDKIRHLQGDGFTFTLVEVMSASGKLRYLRTDLMMAFPKPVVVKPSVLSNRSELQQEEQPVLPLRTEPYVLGGRVPEAMVKHLQKNAGLPTRRASSKVEDEEAA